jgi:hypothetical protein
MLRRSDDDEERAQWSIGLWITLKEKSCRRRHISSSVHVNAFQLLKREKSFWYHIRPYRPTATPTPVMHPSSTPPTPSSAHLASPSAAHPHTCTSASPVLSYQYPTR